MRVRLALGIIGLLVLGGPGCSLIGSATHLVAYRTGQVLDECAERRRNEKWAEQAWQGVQSACPGRSYSDDYAWGFKDGFVHHVFRGGNDDPPPLPPDKYRALRYQTPQGYRAIEDWFAGYRHGIMAARQGGYRDLVTGPSSLRSSFHPVTAPPEPPEVGPPVLPIPPPSEVPIPQLPPPTPVPTGAVWAQQPAQQSAPIVQAGGAEKVVKGRPVKYMSIGLSWWDPLEWFP